jgi:hypothetical protein
MPAIGDLLGFWNGFTDGTGIGSGPVTADDLRAGMFAQQVAKEAASRSGRTSTTRAASMSTRTVP